MSHGTLTGYTYGCRCDECKLAMREYHQRRCPPPSVDREALADLLQELFPKGLTDDCPAARAA